MNNDLTCLLPRAKEREIMLKAQFMQDLLRHSATALIRRDISPREEAWPCCDMPIFYYSWLSSLLSLLGLLLLLLLLLLPNACTHTRPAAAKVCIRCGGHCLRAFAPDDTNTFLYVYRGRKTRACTITTLAEEIRQQQLCQQQTGHGSAYWIFSSFLCCC